jgi:hypothetical protein
MGDEISTLGPKIDLDMIIKVQRGMVMSRNAGCTAGPAQSSTSNCRNWVFSIRTSSYSKGEPVPW